MHCVVKISSFHLSAESSLCSVTGSRPTFLGNHKPPAWRNEKGKKTYNTVRTKLVHYSNYALYIPGITLTGSSFSYPFRLARYAILLPTSSPRAGGGAGKGNGYPAALVCFVYLLSFGKNNRPFVR